MGYSRPIRFTVEHEVAGCSHMTNAEWICRASKYRVGYGKPSDVNLMAYVAHLNASFRPGGVNEHCGPLHVVSARIIDNQNGDVLATWPLGGE